MLSITCLDELRKVKVEGSGALLNQDPDNDTLVIYIIDPKTGDVIGISVEQVEIKYGKDGKAKYIIITDPVVIYRGDAQP